MKKSLSVVALIGKFWGGMLLFFLIIISVFYFRGIFSTVPQVILNRTGIFLEILGLLSVLPEIVGEEFIAKISYGSSPVRNQVDGIFRQIKNFLDAPDEYFFESETIKGIVDVINYVGMVFGALLMLFVLWAISSPGPWQSQPSDFKLIVYYFNISTVIWLVIPIIARSQSKTSQNKLVQILQNALFILAKLNLWFLALPFTFTLAIMINLVVRISLFLLNISFKKAVILVTLPLVFAGNLLQLLSTF